MLSGCLQAFYPLDLKKILFEGSFPQNKKILKTGFLAKRRFSQGLLSEPIFWLSRGIAKKIVVRWFIKVTYFYEREVKNMNYFALQPDESYFCVWFQNENKHIFKTAKDLSKIDFSNKENVFFTPNSLGFRKNNGVNAIWRDRNHLQCFESLYCDIDLEADQEPEEVYKYIQNHVIGVELPCPTMAVCSGNGLHLYWNIESVSYRGNIEKWQKAQEYIYSCLRMVGADQKVTDDFVRVLRLPDTINQKNGICKKCYVIEQNSTKYDLNRFIEEYAIETVSKQNRVKRQHKNKQNDNVFSFYNELFKKRVHDLETLLLQYRDFEKSGRENILFLYRYYWLELLKDEQKAQEKTVLLNSRLKYPLSDKEVRKATKSAEKYHFGNKLKWTNEKLIEWLEITEEEQKSLSVLCGASVRKDRKSDRNKADYQKRLQKAHKRTKSEMVFDRQCKIYELLKKGRNKEQICMKLHISERTFYNDLKAIKEPVFIGAYNKTMEINEIANGTTGILENIGTVADCRKFSTLNYLSSAEHCDIENTPFYHYLPPHPHI